jgi:hypothetical protein
VPDLSPELVKCMVIGLLMERLGVAAIKFPAREIRWGLSGTSVHLYENTAGDLQITLLPLGNLGIPGAAPVCPWPYSETTSPSRPSKSLLHTPDVECEPR